MQQRPKNTADAVLRPGRGGLRCSVSSKLHAQLRRNPRVRLSRDCPARRLLLW